MKKILTITLLFIVLIGRVAVSEFEGSYDYKRGNFTSMLTASDVGLLDMIALPDAATTIDVATTVAQASKRLRGNGTFCVYFDMPTETWIISFDADPNELGGELYVALAKSDAKVLKIWYEE